MVTPLYSGNGMAMMHLNLTNWDKFSPEKQADKAKDMCKMVSKGKMPPEGEGNDPNPYQMAIRAFIIFIIALVFIRLSGRRTFGMFSPFDNVISVLLGAVLSRAVIGHPHFFQPLLQHL
jgi:hypothetical protein